MVGISFSAAKSANPRPKPNVRYYELEGAGRSIPEKKCKVYIGIRVGPSMPTYAK